MDAGAYLMAEIEALARAKIATNLIAKDFVDTNGAHCKIEFVLCWI
jgi:hypothetical protein